MSRGREIGLTDFQMNNVLPLLLERARPGENFVCGFRPDAGHSLSESHLVFLEPRITRIERIKIRVIRSIRGQNSSHLDQSRCSLRPRFRAFFFRDRFHILHIGAGLRQDVMQIVADADERETFLEELTDARRSKQEESQDDVVLPGRRFQLLGGFAHFR